MARYVGRQTESGDEALRESGPLSTASLPIGPVEIGEFLHMHQSDGDCSAVALTALCDELEALIVAGRFRLAAARFERFAPAVPLGPASHEAEAYYDMAIAFSWAGKPDQARDYMTRAMVGPAGDHEFLTYPAMLLSALELKQRQKPAIDTVPAIMITAMPKSASAFVSNTLGRALDIPVFRASFGRLESACVIEQWARQINRGGAVTHEHYFPAVGNLEALSNAGVRRVFVQTRDPRAAVWSLHHHNVAQLGKDRAPDVDETYRRFYSIFANWYDAWLGVTENKFGIDVELIDYEEVRQAPEQVFERILSLSGYLPGLDRVLTLLHREKAAGKKPDNFRVGDPDDWRKHLSQTEQHRLFAATPKRVQVRLDESSDS